MALFKKNKTTSTNIPELQEYYANQQKESAGKAWLLAIGSLLVTVVVLVGAFFGGRWAYRKLTNKDKPATTTTAQKTNVTESTTKSTSTTTTTPSSTSTTSTPSTSTSSTTSTTTTKPAEGVSTTQSTTTNTAATAASTTVATTVPDTGAGNTIGLFAAVMAVSYSVHRAVTRRKLNK